MKMYIKSEKAISLIFIILLVLSSSPFYGFAQEPDLKPVSVSKDGRLLYGKDEDGNRVPDFSYAGYKASESEIPFVEPKVVVAPVEGDATLTIQKALNYVASLPLNENGFRGAVLLQKGTFKVNGRLVIKASGVVLRGSGFGDNGTTLIAGGKDRQTFIRILGKSDQFFTDTTRISNSYVPVNAMKFVVENTEAYKVGDPVIVHRLSSQKWIERLSMVEFGGEETGWIGWKPGNRDIYWDRTITAIEGDTIFVDAPLTTALDTTWGASGIIKYNWKGRINNIGIENLNLESAFDETNLKDENHCWSAITIENAENVWVRQLTFKHFAGSAVAVYETAKKVTVQDCVSTDPVSEIGGQRRYTFFTMGQQTLFQRLYAEYGYHDFALGFCAAGPNVFVQCESHLPYEYSGTIDSWASGVLFDIVNVDGHAISFKNQMLNRQGAGWTAANSMLWQCSAALIENYAPPTAMNWSYGAWSQFSGNGYWAEENNHVTPRSLFYAQLADRLDKKTEEFADQVMPFDDNSTSSPTAEQAQELTEQAYTPALRLEDWIMQADDRDPISLEAATAIKASELKDKKKIATEVLHPITVENGKLVKDDLVLTGMRFTVPWWRGVARPYATKKATPAVTRYVPGRNGHGYTDNLNEVIDWMDEYNMVGLEHNYGLWYDRRRDDHQRVRRMDGQVWAPFYQQPFARSGQGTAWDGLSKYDLTKYDDWYWNRLADFADLADKNGKLLVHHNYFQHNILEAGAHWADSPWRPANNINNTGFPEPVPYAGDKRIYMAKQFYDESHPVRRKLHQAYIRQCLNNFADNSNVLQLISAEYTGPLHFTEFWLETIDNWQKETGEDKLIGLSTTKDVQDSILANKKYADLIDVIDIRYWSYREDGTLYAPLSAQQLAPRQHARQVKPGKRSFSSVYRSVFEYTSQYPEKAVVFSEGRYNVYGWAAFMAGGSLVVLPENLPAGFLSDAISMRPVKPDANPEEECSLESDNALIIYSQNKSELSIDLTGRKGRYVVKFIQPPDGTLLNKETIIKGGEKQAIKLPQKSSLITWIKKQQ
ncbi:DUF6298 domain-containing protein [Sunxiuqinia indica]|uniref:DUF6298 domain-containing protein n=1 Tax=Sunxiuqinia indica TaxID=2692584 RepID=UPI001915810C|nr:DUF6298 domain-containing protein [Sunxiuqinia indica]